jgi:hypothetical protein
MDVLHFSAIAIGAAALALPVAIHFLTRPRPVRIPLSTVRFVRQAVRDQRARHRLRDWLVLALRTLAVALLALCFARPQWQQRPLVDLNANETNISRVAILDCSQSMGTQFGGKDTMQLARVQAARFLEGGSGLRANLILAAAQPRAVFESLSSNLPILRDELKAAESSPERLDPQAAVNRAAVLLGASSGENNESTTQAPKQQRRELVVVSDFQRTNWSSVDFSVLPEGTVIQLESVVGEALRPNVAIENVALAQRATWGSSPNLEITVANYSAEPSSLRCQVEVDQNVVVLENICQPFAKVSMVHPITLSTQGWLSGRATLLDNNDWLTADDQYPFALQVQSRPVHALITRQSPAKRATSSYFLEQALLDEVVVDAGDKAASPQKGQSTTTGVRRVFSNEFDLQAIDGCQLLVIDHPGKFSDEQIDLLATLLRRGRSVFYVVSEQIDAVNIKRLRENLGAELQSPVDFDLDRGSERINLAIASVQRQSSPFSIFGDQLTPVLANIRISGGLPTRRTPNSLDDEILARLSDQSALLVVNKVGAGQLALLNADLGTSNLPQQTSFVPLMSELVDGLIQTAGDQRSLWCGEPVVRLLNVAATLASDLRAVDSRGNEYGEFRASGDAVAWEWQRPVGPTVVQIKQGDDTVAAFGTALHHDESDLRTLDAKIMTERLAGGRNVQFRTAGGNEVQDSFWVWLAVGCIVAMIGETLALAFWRT